MNSSLLSRRDCLSENVVSVRVQRRAPFAAAALLAACQEETLGGMPALCSRARRPRMLRSWRRKPPHYEPLWSRAETTTNLQAISDAALRLANASCYLDAFGHVESTPHRATQLSLVISRFDESTCAPNDCNCPRGAS